MNTTEMAFAIARHIDAEGSIQDQLMQVLEEVLKRNDDPAMFLADTLSILCDELTQTYNELIGE